MINPPDTMSHQPEAETLDSRQFGMRLREMLPSLSRYASSLARDRELAQDLVQDTAARAWQHRDRFVPGTNLKAWLYRILRNCFLSHVRRGRVAKTYTYGDDLPEVAVASSQESSLVLKDVGRFWLKLAPDQQRAIELIAIDGRSYEEAATIERISIGTLKSRVSRGRKILTAMLDGDAAGGNAVDVSSKPHLVNDPPPSALTAPERPAGSDDRDQIEMLRAWRRQREAVYEMAA